MWIKETRVTQIFSTVFHKHKYITNPDIIPKDRVIEEASKLSDNVKGHMRLHLSETILEQLERIGTILKHERT